MRTEAGNSARGDHTLVLDFEDKGTRLMRKIPGSAMASAAIGGAAFVLALAIFSRVGTAVERQRAGAPPPPAASAPAAPAPRPATAAPAQRAPAGGALVDYEREIKP